MNIPNDLEPGWYLVKVEPNPASADNASIAKVYGEIKDYEEVKALHLTVSFGLLMNDGKDAKAPDHFLGAGDEGSE